MNDRLGDAAEMRTQQSSANVTRLYQPSELNAIKLLLISDTEIQRSAKAFPYLHRA